MKIDPKKHPYSYEGHHYAERAVNGDLPVAVSVGHACKRYFDDLEKEKKGNWKYYLDPDKSERFMKLFQKFKHVKGEWKTPNIKLEPWQCFIYLNVYAWRNHSNGHRRFRTAHVEIPRGNGKSAMASVTGLFHLSLEAPKGNEVYSAATGRDQARIVLDSARAMAQANKSFLNATGTRVLANKILHERSNSFFKALSADSNTLDGLQPACAMIDELHAHRNRKVFDVIDSAMSKRPDSLLFVITTAGFDTSGIGYSQSAYAKKVASGDVLDDTFFSFVSCPDKGDDLFDPATWEKVNPNWGVSVDPENFAAKAIKAMNSPDAKSNFLVKHLNMWLNAMTPYFNMEKWDECEIKGMSIKQFYGQKCFSGVDLATTTDLAGFSYVFKDSEGYYNVFCDAFIPEARVNEGVNDSYSGWCDNGWLNKTTGEVINLEKIGEYYNSKIKMFKSQGTGFDPWSATEFSQRQMTRGVEMVEFKMNVGNMSEPMKKLLELILEGKIRHNGNPVLRWCLSNVVAKKDANENVYPRKDNDKLKIDLAIALIIAIALHIEKDRKTSPYETKGLVVI